MTTLNTPPPPPAPPKRSLEKQLQNEILRVFGTRQDMRIWRQNTGVARYGRRTVRFGVPGQADLTGILPGGVRLEIEVKAPGGKQTPEQKQYQQIIARFGGVYCVARSLEDVWRAVENYGVRRMNEALAARGCLKSATYPTCPPPSDGR